MNRNRGRQPKRRAVKFITVTEKADHAGTAKGKVMKDVHEAASFRRMKF